MLLRLLEYRARRVTMPVFPGERRKRKRKHSFRESTRASDIGRIDTRNKRRKERRQLPQNYRFGRGSFANVINRLNEPRRPGWKIGDASFHEENPICREAGRNLDRSRRMIDKVESRNERVTSAIPFRCVSFGSFCGSHGLS